MQICTYFYGWCYPERTLIKQQAVICQTAITQLLISKYKQSFPEIQINIHKFFQGVLWLCRLLNLGFWRGWERVLTPQKPLKNYPKYWELKSPLTLPDFKRGQFRTYEAHCGTIYKQIGDYCNHTLQPVQQPQYNL